MLLTCVIVIVIVNGIDMGCLLWIVAIASVTVVSCVSLIDCVIGIDSVGVMVVLVLLL